MKKPIIVFVLFGSFFIVNSCIPDQIRGSGIIISEDRELDEFNRIDLRGSADIYLVQGDYQTVRIETDDNIIEQIETEVKGKELIINSSKGFMNPNRLNIFITLTNLKSLKISGSGSVKSESIFKTDDMEIWVTGSGHVIMDLTSSEIEVKVTGSGDVVLSGEADEFQADISGSGTVDGIDFKTKVADVDISGSGEIHIYVTDNLNARVSGSGDVKYKGQPKVNSRITGSGTISTTD